MIKTTVHSLRCAISEVLLTEKAIKREKWKEHITKYLTCAIREFYKARLGEKNKISVQQDIDHWDKEVHDLLDGALNTYSQTTKSKFDRAAAYHETCEEIRSIDAAKRRNATRIIMRDYKLTIVPKLIITDEDTTAFWHLADATMLDEEITP